MFLPRLLSSFLLITLFTFIVFDRGAFGFGAFCLLCLAVSWGASGEAINMLAKVDKPGFRWLGVVVAVGMVGSVLATASPMAPLLVLAAHMIVCWLLLLRFNTDPRLLEKIVNTTAAVTITIVPLMFIPLVYLSGDGVISGGGGYLVLYLVMVTKSGDIGAYSIGVLSNNIMGGNHKIIPSISPKKSWEGTIGGMLVSIGVGIWLWLALEFPGAPTIGGGLGAAMFVGGFLGDLSESSLKRICGVKDSGRTIPGIGGVLDLLDSLMLNAPVFYLILLIIGHWQP